jgi:hypothetical protein
MRDLGVVGFDYQGIASEVTLSGRAWRCRLGCLV